MTKYTVATPTGITILLLLLCTVLPRPVVGEPWVYGYVTDTHGAPVSGAVVSFLVSGPGETAFSGVSNSGGRYEIDSALSIENGRATNPGLFALSQNFPNPFNPLTRIPFTVDGTLELSIAVYNTLGQRVKHYENTTYQAGSHSITWDGTNDAGAAVGAGLYFCRLTAGQHTDTIKMLLIDGGVGLQPPSSRANSSFAGRTAVDTYDILVTGSEIERYERKNVSVASGDRLDFTVSRINDVPFKTLGDHLAVRKDDGYVPLFIKGVNMGVGIPGRHPGELAPTGEQYRHWFERIHEIGFNCVRIYTLHFPRFYDELAAFNLEHEEEPLYLFQGIWLDEENPGSDLYAMSEEFDLETMRVLDSIHGSGTIEFRRGKAYGTYTADVSRWTIGYIMGREIYPNEVTTTNSLHPQESSYTGNAVSLDAGSATEVWAAARIDNLIVHERDSYGVQRPVSMSSWPTLDPLEHPSETDNTLEDIISIDLLELDTSNAPGGYFASYHAYPYYPNFISNDTKYQSYSDETGPNSYLGYLSELKQYYASIPLIIAEYGVPSSWGNAHYSHSGMNHGGLDEVRQGEYNNRMLRNIYDTGCGGGMLFALFDEWFKNSWITSPLDSDSERRPLFHNLTNPEQNYGLIAFDAGEPDYDYWPETGGSEKISRIRTAYDNECFYIEAHLNAVFSESDTLVIGYDTYRSDTGESVLPDGSVTGSRAELALKVTYDSATLYVTEAYDLFSIWHGTAEPQQLFHSTATDGSPWIKVRWKNGTGENDIQDIGDLPVRHEASIPTSLDAVEITGNRIKIRMPWTLLQFTDPSGLIVMDDDRMTAERETAVSEGIAVTVSIGGEIVETGRQRWDPWNVLPQMTERDKESLEIVRRGLREIPGLTPVQFAKTDH